MVLFLSIGTKLGGGAGGDWLGLGGDDDGSLDLSNASFKSSTPFPKESKKDTPSGQGIFTHLTPDQSLFDKFFLCPWKFDCCK